MTVLFVILSTLLVLAVVVIAIWLWLFIDIGDQAAALIRIKVEEQVAVRRIEALGRIARLEQQQERDRHGHR